MNWIRFLLRFIILGLFFIILILALVITIIGMAYIIDVELQLYFKTSFREIRDIIKNRKIVLEERINKRLNKNSDKLSIVKKENK